MVEISCGKAVVSCSAVNSKFTLSTEVTMSICSQHFK